MICCLEPKGSKALIAIALHPSSLSPPLPTFWKKKTCALLKTAVSMKGVQGRVLDIWGEGRQLLLDQKKASWEFICLEGTLLHQVEGSLVKE